MKLISWIKTGAAALCLTSTLASASGMVPETSIVIVEQSDGEGSINIKNSDNFPVLLITTLENIKDDTESLLTITPPAARVEPGKMQRVRFIMTSPTPLKTERLKRVIFEGVPPQQKGKNEVRMTVRQNLPVIIRPAGLEKDAQPWKRLVWKQHNGALTVSNPSAYVVRMNQQVQTLPDNSLWALPNTYILPGQVLTLSLQGNRKSATANQVRISPASTWGYSVDSYDAPVSK